MGCLFGVCPALCPGYKQLYYVFKCVSVVFPYLALKWALCMPAVAMQWLLFVPGWQTAYAIYI